jgi:hypothetical protein
MVPFQYLIFVLATIIFWGIYGPLLHDGQVKMGDPGPPSRIRPLICVGLAYFLIAVIVPLIVLWTKGEKGRWSISGFLWSLMAGIVGAFGAIGIVIAFVYHGSPVYVMPLVFGGAPVINTIVTMWMNRTMRSASAAFFLGIAIVAAGAAGVMYFKPGGGQQLAVISGTNLAMVVAGILLTALSWGSYGPMLHRGQAKMEGSRLRPFLCVGLAYLLVAVIAPLALQSTVLSLDSGSWNWPGTLWSLAAGAVGAMGALGIIYAFNFGGKPIVVMPLVFGGAPVVNTFFEIARHADTWGQISRWFYISLAVVIAGAVTVLLTAPRAVHSSKPS